MQPKLTAIRSLTEATSPDQGWDALVLITGVMPPRLPAALEAPVRALVQADRAAANAARLIVSEAAPGSRLILAPTGPLLRDHDDVRAFNDAAAAGMKLAIGAGAVRPCLAVLAVPAGVRRYVRALEVSLLAALEACWAPLEAREALGDEVVEPVEAIGFVEPDELSGARVARWVQAVEEGRRLARDLAGTNPERMSPARVAAACVAAFEGTGVEVEVVEDRDTLRADYPLLYAVARASDAVPRHRPCVVRLVWQGDGPVERTLLLAGKGVTYDTGGVDLKVGGHMVGMSRDKGGAAAVAGVVLTAGRLRPPGLRIVAELGMVRNSIGSDAFVSDEIVVSHAGARVRIGNTDAEGRLVLADLLSHLRQQAERSPAPHLYSVATLTGHAALAWGPYTAVIDNGPARAGRHGERLREHGERWGEPIELSSLRREDYQFVRARTAAEDVVSANNRPSSQTPRGHQFPVAFLEIASGLVQHGTDGELPIAYTHVDIAGSGVRDGDWQHGVPTAAPVLALAAAWLQERAAEATDPPA
jgi:leucyl aminopeptidase